MTIFELAQRDLGNAHRAHTYACTKPNVPAEELVHTLELVELRKQILEIVKKNDHSVTLPVKPGDTVYTISRGKIKEWTVYFVGMNSLGEFTFNIADAPLENSRSVWDREIGETVFLTQGDVINELKERSLNRR